MASAGTDKLKLLFVVSRDFGELTRAIYFAQEPEFESCLLIRPSVSTIQADDVPVPFRTYESVADVLAADEGFQPDAVFLFSGYLFLHDGIFSGAELGDLVRSLRQRGRPVFTSDPVFGWLRGLNASMSEAGPEHDPGPPRPPETCPTAAEMSRDQRRRFLGAFGGVDAILEPLPHVYDLSPPPGFVTGEPLVYSNRRMVTPPGRVPGLAEFRQALGLDPARPRWAFVMAREEYKWLTQQQDETPGIRTVRSLARTNRFHDLVTDQMYEVLGQGRQPVLVAPPDCTSAVALRSSPAEGIILLPDCRHSWFTALLLEAEYVFNWNMFSNSLKLRAANRLPFFLFESGHIGRSNPALMERMARCYYAAGVPPFLDFSQPLDAGELAQLAAKQEPLLQGMADTLLRSPRPAEALRQFLHGVGPGVNAPQAPGPVIGRGPAAWAD